MNQTLVSSCPNCGFDASKHNKVLYNGIYLICYNCGYGWYYNIEITNPNNFKHLNNSASNKPISNKPINYNYNTNDLAHYNHTFKQKNKNIISKNKSLPKKYTNNNVASNIHYNININKKNTIKYHNKNKYDNNIYYEPDVNNKTYTKKQSYSINNQNTNDPNKICINKNKYLNLDNTLKFPLTNKANKNIYNKKSFQFNKVKQNISTNKKNNSKSNKIFIIDISKFPKENNLTFTYNKLSPQKSYYNNKQNSRHIAVDKEIKENIKTPDSLNLEKTNILATKHSLITTPVTNHSLSKQVYTHKSLSNQLYNQQTYNKEYANNNHNALACSLSNKTQLGLADINLLKFEAQSNYNLEQFTQSIFDFKQIISSFTDFIKDILFKISKIPSLIFSIFTCLDIFLKTTAYLFILTLSIGFLSYSYYKKQNNITSTRLENSDCRNEALVESNKSLIFENNNFFSINSLDNNFIKNYSLSKEILKIVEQKIEEKIIAFEKNKGKNTLEKPNVNNTLSNLNKQNNEQISLVDNIKYAINNSLFSLKKLQINTFNNVKIYNNGFTLQGEYNNVLVTCATLCNEDNKNAYLIRSLEVIFLEKSGKKIGKRIIITNQLINANNAISINLQINNPPRNTNKIFIFIKDKKQI